VSVLPRGGGTSLAGQTVGHSIVLDFSKYMQNVFEVEYLHPKTGEALKKKFVTGEVFEENEMLMDLTKQPDVIQEMIVKAIDYGFANRGTYHMVKFMRYCNRMDFQHLIHNIQNYNKLLKGPSRSTLTA
jgi:hypothetical protein